MGVNHTCKIYVNTFSFYTHSTHSQTVPTTFPTHGSTSSSSHDCDTPPTPTSATTTTSSSTTTPSHSQTTAQPFTAIAESCNTNLEMEDSMNVSSASLGTGTLDENPIGCDTGELRTVCICTCMWMMYVYHLSCENVHIVCGHTCRRTVIVIATSI